MKTPRPRTEIELPNLAKERIDILLDTVTYSVMKSLLIEPMNIWPLTDKELSSLAKLATDAQLPSVPEPDTLELAPNATEHRPLNPSPTKV